MSERRRRRPSHDARLRYLEAGLEVLADRGRGGLKLATVCDHVGTTSGSFYHAFDSWSEFTDELIRFWREHKTVSLIAHSNQIVSARERLVHLIEVGIKLPHRSEAAIRSWAATDPKVAEVVADVDRERLDALTASYAQITPDALMARRYAVADMYLLIGHQTAVYGTTADLQWAFEVLLERALTATPTGPSSIDGAATTDVRR